MNFWKTFKPKSCSVHLQATSKEEALAEVVENLISGESMPARCKEDAIEALLAREKLGSTGVGMGVAIPHVKIRGLERAACSLSVHTSGLEWHALDGGQVHLLFTVLRPDKPGENHDPQRHLEMMQWIARLAREPDFRRFACKVKTKTELVDLLKEMSTV